MAIINRLMRVESNGTNTTDLKRSLSLINKVGGELISVNTLTLEMNVITDLYYRAEEAIPLTVEQLRTAVVDFIEQLRAHADREEYPLSVWESFLEDRLFELNAHTDKMLSIPRTVNEVAGPRSVYFDFQNKRIRDADY